MLGLGQREPDAMLAWVGENLTLVRRLASGSGCFTGSSGSARGGPVPLMSADSCSNPGDDGVSVACYSTTGATAKTRAAQASKG